MFNQLATLKLCNIIIAHACTSLFCSPSHAPFITLEIRCLKLTVGLVTPPVGRASKGFTVFFCFSYSLTRDSLSLVELYMTVESTRGCHLHKLCTSTPEDLSQGSRTKKQCWSQVNLEMVQRSSIDYLYTCMP